MFVEEDGSEAYLLTTANTQLSHRLTRNGLPTGANQKTR